jgi:hypothetical protein
VNRARCIVILAALAAGCSGGSEKPGGVLRGPGALAAFDGIVAHETGTQRLYLAVANERGDELRLVDATDNEVVTSPGLVFPLSIPSSGRPTLLASADLGDGLPDALVVVSSGSNRVELVDTWSGFPAVVAGVDFASGVEILSLAGAAIPGGAPGAARILVGLSSGQLAVLDAVRSPGGTALALVEAAGSPVALGFEPLSIAQGVAPDRFVYVATRDTLPGAVQGVAKLSLPGDLATASLVASLDARAPTERVAVADFGAWDPATGQFGASAGERVVAVPSTDACGEGFAVRCGLLAIDVGTGALAANWVAGEAEDHLHPLELPAPVSGLAATGRTASALAAITTAAGTVLSTGLGVVTSDDGRIYLVDLARWSLASDTSPVVGASKTRVTSADAQPGAAGAIGLWGFSGEPLSAADGDLAARIRVTPGFTPNETWTLAWQGTLPALSSRAAVLRRDGAGLWLAVQAIGGTEPTSVVQLASRVAVGDSVEVGQSALACANGLELTVAEVGAAAAGYPGGSVRLVPPAGSCLETEPASGTLAAVATFRAAGLVLSGAFTGLSTRPVASETAPVADQKLLGPRRFYVTDACTGDCAASWPGLVFPFPSGDTATVALRPGFLAADGATPTATPPSRGTSIVFQTASGLVPSGRRPIIDGSPVSSALPSGLAVVDGGASGTGAQVYASFTAGLVVSLSTAAAPGSMTVIR